MSLKMKKKRLKQERKSKRKKERTTTTAHKRSWSTKTVFIFFFSFKKKSIINTHCWQHKTKKKIHSCLFSICSTHLCINMYVCPYTGTYLLYSHLYLKKNLFHTHANRLAKCDIHAYSTGLQKKNWKFPVKFSKNWVFCFINFICTA